MAKLDGKVALVTGAGSGIGQAIAIRFAREGATVVANDLSAEHSRDTLAKLRAESLVALAIAADVSDAKAVDRMHAKVLEHFGKLDVLVNNAAIPEGRPGEIREVNEAAKKMMGEFATTGRSDTRFDIFLRVDDASWQKMLSVVLSGAFFNMRAAIPGMVERGGGAIVNISSGAALVATPSLPHYAAGKAGMLALTRAVAADYGRAGIRANAILPGLIDTPAQRAGLDPAMRVVLAGQTPLGRLGRSEEIAAAVAFLASDDASYMTGQSLEVNGGMH